MKIYQLLTIFTLCLLLVGCNQQASHTYIIDGITEHSGEEVVLDHLIEVRFKNKELAIYKNHKNEINVYLFQHKEIIQVDSIPLDALIDDDLYWVYSEGSDYSYLVGGISKNVKPDILVNHAYFTGHILNLTDATIFFTFYESPLDMPIDVRINN